MGETKTTTKISEEMKVKYLKNSMINTHQQIQEL